MATILVTNDDGVQSSGLLALKQGLSRLGDVVVLAPERNWSASSHAKTMHKPLRVTPVTLADGSAGHSCSGSPTDCVALAAYAVLGAKPDLVVSGINAGYNLAIDVTYSGTVACAMEATIQGIPGIAVSTAWDAPEGVEMAAIHARAAEVACGLAEEVLAKGLPAGTLLNVNVPGVDPAQLRGIHMTRMGHRRYPMGDLIERNDPRGTPYYWLGGETPVDQLDDGTDVGAIANGFISVTPVTLDMTHYTFLAELSHWASAAMAAERG